MNRKLSDDVLESLIIKGVLNNKEYLTLLMNSFEPDYFDNPTYKEMYEAVVTHYKDNMTLIDKFIIKDMVECKDAFDTIESIEFDIDKDYGFLVDETNGYLKEKAIKASVLESIDIIDTNKDIGQIREKVESALAKDLTMNLGVDYWSTIGDRLKQILVNNDSKVPLYYPMLDEFINYGLPSYSLSLFLSRIHGFKSTLLINMMERLSSHDRNVIIFSMEMSELEISKRLDSISTLSDINKMHTSKENIKELAVKLIKQKKNGKGIVIIKEFPTGDASVNDFRTMLREYEYRGINFDVIFCDYVTIMKSEKHSGIADNMYLNGKAIAEELRSLSLEFQTPVVSVSQLNRTGMECDFKEIDLTYVAESISIAAAADFMAIMGKSEEDLVYESELHYKITKNRFGGMVGTTGKFYVDKRSLKLYDSSELDVWVLDAQSTGDEREVSKKY